MEITSPLKYFSLIIVIILSLTSTKTNAQTEPDSIKLDTKHIPQVQHCAIEAVNYSDGEGNLQSEVQFWDYDGQEFHKLDELLTGEEKVYILTHGWNGAENTERFRDLHKALYFNVTGAKVLRLVWEEGAASGILPTCAPGVSRNTPHVGVKANVDLVKLGLPKTAEIQFIGESFGNAVNAYISNAWVGNGGKRGNALILNPASRGGFALGVGPNGKFGLWRDFYADAFDRSISIQTIDVGDTSLYRAGDYGIKLRKPHCIEDSVCHIFGNIHTSLIQIMACMIGGELSQHFAESPITKGCFMKQIDDNIGFALINTDYRALSLPIFPNEGRFDFAKCIHRGEANSENMYISDFTNNCKKYVDYEANTLQMYKYTTREFDFENLSKHEDFGTKLSGTTESLQFELKNTGTSVWYRNNTYLTLTYGSRAFPLRKNENPFTRGLNLSWYESSNTFLYGLRFSNAKNSVAPGETALFTGYITVPSIYADNFDDNRSWRMDLYVNGQKVNPTESSSPHFTIDVACSDLGIKLCDVPRDHTHFNDIEPLVRAGYWPDHRITTSNNPPVDLIPVGNWFDPDAPLTREDFAVVIKRLLLNRLDSSGFDHIELCKDAADRFSDIDSSICNPNFDQEIYERESAIGYLIKATTIDNGSGETALPTIIQGYGDGTFRSNSSITRGQMMSLIVRLFGARVESGDVSSALLDDYYNDNLLLSKQFTDVDTIEETHHRDILFSRHIGLVDGFTDGTFGKDLPITRAQASKVILNTWIKLDEFSSIQNSRSSFATLHPTEDQKYSSNSSSQQMSGQYYICHPTSPAATFDEFTVPRNNSMACFDSIAEEYFLVSDVTDPHPALVSLYGAGITEGCSSSNGRKYCPTEALTRDEIAVFILRAKHYYSTCLAGQCESGLSYTPPNRPDVFVDVVTGVNSLAPWINELYHQGLTNGDTTCRPDGDDRLYFCPGEKVNRTQMMLFILRALLGPDFESDLPAPFGIFEDVLTTDRHAAAYEELYRRNITVGSPACSDDLDALYYCPDEVVSRDQAAIFLSRAFINIPTVDELVGDVCFSSDSSFELPFSKGRFYGVKKDDVVCYHSGSDRYKMLFNSNSNQLLPDGNIDALSFDGNTMYFSFNGDETVPGIGTVNDADVLSMEDGQIKRIVQETAINGLNGEDIYSFHFYDSETYYFSTAGNADYSFEARDEDIVQLNAGVPVEFFDGSDVETLSEFYGMSVKNNDPANTSVYMVLRTQDPHPDLPTSTGVELKPSETDIVLFNGRTGSGGTSGTYNPDICLAVREDLPTIGDIDALHVNNLPCDPPEELEPAVEYPEDAEEYKVSISPNNVIFDFEINDADTKTETINISNGGYLGSVIEWNAQTESEWLTVSKTSGLTTDSITLTADKSNLEKGLYQALVEFISPETEDSEFLIAYLEIYDETTSNNNPPTGQGTKVFLPFVTTGNSANPPGSTTPAPPASTSTPTPSITPTITLTPSPTATETPTPEVPQIPINTPLQLINQKSDKCLDTFLAQTHNSVKPIQFTCAETASFFWRIVPSDDSGYYRVIHQQSGRCLSPANSSNEEWSRLHIYDCDNNDEAHKWAIEPQGNAFQIRNKLSNLCVDTYLGSVEDWTELIQFSCTGADSLQWRFDSSVTYPGDPQVSNRFRLRNRWNPYCLASIGNSQEVDNNVGMGTCDSSNSIWSWDGQQLRNEWNPYCLASIGNSQDIDNNVVMGTCNQSNGIWFWADGNHLRNGWHPSCMGSIGNSQEVDNNVVMGTCNQLNAEWYVEYVP